MLVLALIAVFVVSLRISGFMYHASGVLEQFDKPSRSLITSVGGIITASCCTFLFYYLT